MEDGRMMDVDGAVSWFEKVKRVVKYDDSDTESEGTLNTLCITEEAFIRMQKHMRYRYKFENRQCND